MAKLKDPERAQFERDILQSIDEMKRGDFARTHTPAEMTARVEARKAGRPVGSVKENPKVALKIRYDADVAAALKAHGRGWQTRANELMRKAVLGSAARR